MSRVVHFEISADEPERAIRFYADVFGWQAQKWDGPHPYWLFVTGPEDQPGINGGMFLRGGPVSYVNTIDVPSVDASVERVTAHGGTVVMPKMVIPGVGYLAYCQDTEGNAFGVMQQDSTVTA